MRASGSDLGFVIDPDGEVATVVDDTGRILPPDTLLLALVALVTEAHPGATIAVPVHVTDAVEKIASATGSSVIRTRLWGGHLMETASSGEVAFAGTPDGAFIWPDFLPAYDATVTLAKLLDLLAAAGRPLSRVVSAMPDVHVVHDSVVTPWERKGAVMREIVEHAGNDVVLVDGVKVVGDGRWALVLPDPEEALTHVWAEAGSDIEARRLALDYTQRIRQVLR